jgi:hypothetical protein
MVWGLFGGFRDLALWGSLVLWRFPAGFVVCFVFGLLVLWSLGLSLLC